MSNGLCRLVIAEGCIIVHITVTIGILRLTEGIVLYAFTGKNICSAAGYAILPSVAVSVNSGAVTSRDGGRSALTCVGRSVIAAVISAVISPVSVSVSVSVSAFSGVVTHTAEAPDQ